MIWLYYATQRTGSIRLLVAFWVYLLAVSGIAWAHPAHSDTLWTHTFTSVPETPITLHISGGLWIDSSGNMDIGSLLSGRTPRFAPLEGSQDIGKGTLLWARFRLANENDRAIHAFLKPFVCADTISIYYVKDGHITDRYFTGIAFPPRHQSVRSMANLIPVHVDANSSIDIYMKMTVCVKTSASQAGRLVVHPAGMLINSRLTLVTWQSLYMGIMMLICFVSLIMFLLFRDRLFIYYVLMMFFLGLYFPRMYGVLDPLAFPLLGNPYISLAHIIISGIVIFTFLFISRYTSLKQVMPRYFWLYLTVSLAAFLFVHIGKLLGYPTATLMRPHNFIMLAWVVICFFPIFRSSLKPDPAARVLLVSIVFMFLGSVVLILNLLKILPSIPMVQHSFQFGVLAFSGILFYGLFDRIRSIQDERQRIKELDGLKSRFFANISHEFRTPLTLIMGPVEQVMERTDDPEDKRLLGMAKGNASRLLQLVNQLLDLSRINTGKMTLHVREMNLTPLLRNIVQQFGSLAESKGISLKYVSQKDDIPLFVDVDKVEKVFYNLLSNAFRFTEEGGEISVMVIDKGDEVEVLVRDTGAGISEDMLSHIFEHFHQGSKGDESQGSGIGLALVKELMELQGGSIHVESQEGRGSTFTVRFRKGAGHINDQDLAAEAPTDSPPEASGGVPAGYAEPEAQLELTNGNDLPEEVDDTYPTLLLIEDNTDMRDFIRQHLSPSYKMLEAPNGTEGIALARKHLPDLIISDVMMPGADGYEVCRTLKEDKHTSHIPIVLLTAKAETREKLEGLHTGADDYLVKPFNTQELEARIHNLIEQRKALRERFLADALGTPHQIDGAHTDKAFLKQVTETIDAHLTNPQFSVEMLAAEVGFSRAHMNRKLNALTGLSANKFILDYRLQLALAMLRNGEHNVSEIGYKAGFGSTSYFVKCFREKFGTPPGALLKK